MRKQETLADAIERQKEIEAEAQALGIQRYRRGDLPWRDRAPADRGEDESTPGRLLLKANVDKVADAIRAFMAAASSGKAGRKHIAVKYLQDVDPLQAAYLALRHCLNAPSADKPLTWVGRNVGGALRDHLEMLAMAEDHPGLYRKVSRQLARSTSAHHREGVLRHVKKKYETGSLGWSQADCIHVGVKLVELVMESTDLFQRERPTRGHNNRPYVLHFAPEVLAWLEEAHGRCELLSPIHLPMVAPPRQWKTPFAGGYLTSILRPRLVRTRNQDYLSDLGGVDLTGPLRAVNAIQATPWRINRPVLEVMLREIEVGGNTAGLPRTGDLELPPVPPGAPPKGTRTADMTASEREVMAVWKGQAARVHEENASARRDRTKLAQTLYVARRFADEESIYFPHFLDFRGRVYPFASYLNPQSDDIGRGLLEFATGMPLGEDGAFWLAVHIAGLWGVDKVAFEDRVAWVKEHEEQILDSAIDPHAEGAFWRDAEKPWQALAACIDWLGYSVHGAAHVSHTPIAMDGSCSGLQHYSALLRDPLGGAAVNLVPAEKPADIYTAVARRAQVLSDGCSDATMSTAWRGRFVRKVAKQPTMTLCYSATKYGMRQQIQNALVKADREGSPLLGADVDRFQASLYAADIIWRALAETVVAADGAMKWLQAVAELSVEADIPIRWVAPCGLPVLQDYREQTERRLKVHFGGRAVQLSVHSDSDRRSVRQQTSGVAPNFVHSLDASHLLATVNLGLLNDIHHFAVIHDSFATHAANTTLLNAVLRESFVDQYTQPILERFRDEFAAQLAAVRPDLAERIPPLPPCGILDLEAVRDSEFFFA